jgi:catechol 2,3-dioxygenase-like lactoylglutathione lyase family enzyme
MDTHLAVISLWAEVVPTAAHFYRDVIGLKLLPHHAGDRIHFDLDGCVLAIIPGRPVLRPDPEPRFPVVAFSVSDLETAIENLRLHEVALPWGGETNDSGRWVMFHDPAGNLVELVKFN